MDANKDMEIEKNGGEDDLTTERIVISQKQIAELSEVDGDGSSDDKYKNEQASIEVLRDIKFKLVDHVYFVRIWSTRSIKSVVNTASVWKPDTDLSWYAKLGRQKELIRLGHFGVVGYLAPHKEKHASHNSMPQILQMTDMGAMGISGASRHKNILNKLLPHPVRFHLVWSKVQGKQPLFAWEAIPPSNDFVALGHVFTNASAPPVLRDIRCVPKHWLTISNTVPRLVWTDVGTVGRSGSLWSVSTMNHLVAVEGHNPPQRDFYDFRCKNFFCTSDFRMVPAT